MRVRLDEKRDPFHSFEVRIPGQDLRTQVLMESEDHSEWSLSHLGTLEQTLPALPQESHQGVRFRRTSRRRKWSFVLRMVRSGKRAHAT